MPPSWVTPIAGIVGSQVVGRGLGFVIGASAIGRLASWVDGRSLTPFEHRTITSRWMGDLGGGLAELAVEASNLVDGVTARKGAGGSTMGTKRSSGTDWVEVLQRAAAVLVAVGAIMKVVAGIIGDRDRTAAESGAWRSDRNGR